MAKKKLTQEQEKEISILRANNEMLEKTRREMSERGSGDVAMRQIDTAIQEVIEHMRKIDKDSVKDLVERKVEPMTKEPTQTVDSEIFTSLQKVEPVGKKEVERVDEILPTGNTIADEKMFNNIDPSMQYDVIPLPSNGQGYRNKIDRVPVGYLTAYDENFITSPNLYRDGLVIDFLLKNKILNNAIDVDDLLSGDADAIILFLRATSYGTDFPVLVTDPQSGEQIETSIDLSTLKSRPFNLVGDENGWFEYETEMRHDKIKFRYLTRKQEKALRKLTELESYGTKAMVLADILNDINTSMANDDVLSKTDKDTITGAVKAIGKWIEDLKKKNESSFNKIITNNLVMQIMSVNGNTDRDFIKQYVNSMPARESLGLRRYINDNTPGIDFEVEIQRPESLGGGSFKTFLKWDDSVFLNISNV